MIVYGLATLVSAILVWLNIFYNSDVIRVGNRKELISKSYCARRDVASSVMGAQTVAVFLLHAAGGTR